MRAHREIDVVINRTHVLTGDWTALYEELRLFPRRLRRRRAYENDPGHR